MEPVITHYSARDFAERTLKFLKNYNTEPEPPAPEEPQTTKEPIDGPGRVVGTIDYSRFDNITE